MPACDPEKFVNRKEELAYVKDRVTRVANKEPFAPDERVIHFVGPSDIGKSCLLEKCYEAFDLQSKCIPILMKLETFKTGDEEFISGFLASVDEKFCSYQNIPPEKGNESLLVYASEIERKINKQTADHTVVLLLDEINVPSKEELKGIEERLLENLLQGNKRVVLITAGRSSPMLNNFALRPTAKNTFLLSAFDEETTGEQVERLKPGTAHLAGKIQELGGGVPGHNTKLAEQADGEPPSLPDELQAVQALLKEVKSEIEERLLPITESICILQDFQPEDALPLLENHPALGGQWDVRKLRDVFTDLHKVQIGPGGLINWDKAKKSFMMDGPTRQLFERELRMRAPELWRKLHCIMYQKCQTWGEELNSPLYREKAAYHQQCLQAAGMDCEDRGKEA